MSPVVVHHYHFVEELFTGFVSLVEVLDCLNIGRIRDRMKNYIALYADGPNDGDIIFLFFSPLNYQWQNRIPWLPYL
jgi:hypothetical protein